MLGMVYPPPHSVFISPQRFKKKKKNVSKVFWKIERGCELVLGVGLIVVLQGSQSLRIHKSTAEQENFLGPQ